MSQLDVGILLPDLGYNIAPQAGAIQNVGFVHGSHLAAPTPRQIEATRAMRSISASP